MGYFDPGRIFITINRGDYWQCGYVIPKGQAEELRRGGIEAFRDGSPPSRPSFATASASFEAGTTSAS